MLEIIETPIHRLAGICCENEIFIKRDDLLPFSFGGNKVRIADCFLQDMVEKGCNCLIAYGSTRSNLVRVLSNAASSIGIPCYVVSPSEDDESRPHSFNCDLARLFGAVVYPCAKKAVAETVSKAMRDALELGLTPYYIYGDEFGRGNERVPVKAYASAYEEISRWEKKSGIFFDYIFHASGTGMTQAGLLCGSIAIGSQVRIVGISVARDTANGRHHIEKYIRSFSEVDADSIADRIIFEDAYLQGGYGSYGPDQERAMELFLTNEGVQLDSTYTGKAAYGMLSYLSENDIKGKNILFLHTGGTPLFFDGLEASRKGE